MSFRPFSSRRFFKGYLHYLQISHGFIVAIASIRFFRRQPVNGNGLGAVMRHRLLFLPGAGADPLFWQPLGKLLPEEWEKQYFGWPGIGHQPHKPGIQSFADIVKMVEDSLGDEPVDLLAQSMGGAVALRVAMNHPKKIRRLVLAVTAGGIDVAALGASDWRPAYRQEYPQASSWIMEARPSYEDELHKVVHPTLLLWGEQDPISPVAVGQRLSELLPHATLHVIPRGDHAFVHDRPSEISSLIQRHLE
jgi:pimeloyl-ACP methyl ester carboxylesterase